ncbi:hypothetical protein H920_15383 [Fukomys damarensis]|uniref:Uncharacterized protein n=1 Tax=Fukomys damarensis TaxID=885580 RepID=A0A091CYB5_FUKDA|nr:hypothetical protein H920_15383 [Fukomys damarensis]
MTEQERWDTGVGRHSVPGAERAPVLESPGGAASNISPSSVRREDMHFPDFGLGPVEQPCSKESVKHDSVEARNSFLTTA